MKVKRGKVHKYLGMTLEYSTVDQVKTTMLDYIDEIINTFDKFYPTGRVNKSSAAPAIIFKVNKYCNKINAKRSVELNHMVARKFFATKWTRPDTCTTISFLATRVRETNNDDWAKLVRIMKCIIGTRNLPLILSANGSGILKWWIYGSFAVHPNIRRHTGGGNWKSISNCHFNKTKSEHTKFHCNWNCSSGLFDSCRTIDQIFVGRSRIWCFL